MWGESNGARMVFIIGTGTVFMLDLGPCSTSCRQFGKRFGKRLDFAGLVHYTGLTDECVVIYARARVCASCSLVGTGMTETNGKFLWVETPAAGVGLDNGTSPDLPTSSTKALGAFYTDAEVADFLVWWAIRSPHDRIMDPSFGGGVFLRSACRRISEIGGHPASQVLGIEIDSGVHARTAKNLSDEFGVRQQHLLLSDFFAIGREAIGEVDAIVGNPPFVRYQRFAGEARKAAQRRMTRERVQLSGLASSWAPFLVHSISLLRDGGRLAMVLPMEVGHAAYARPVLSYLAESFATVTFLTFQKKLFPNLSEDTLLLLAEEKGGKSEGFLLRDLRSAGELEGLRKHGAMSIAGTTQMQARLIAEGKERLIEYLLPREARCLYRELCMSDRAWRLGELADVGIGYVTGSNAFFHLAPQEAIRWSIPKEFLRPAVLRGRSLSGLRFTSSDWEDSVKAGGAAYLVLLDVDESRVPESVREYLKHGRRKGVHETFKCRTRSPWFRVPHVHEPDAFLSYMSGAFPRLVSNDAKAVATNSLHVLRLHPRTHCSTHAIAALWQTSLTRLSVEIEGHALGGGMLKLEPTEAGNVILPRINAQNGELEELASQLDSLIRQGRETEAQALADRTLLRDGLGLTEQDCELLKMAADSLRRRRYSRT